MIDSFIVLSSGRYSRLHFACFLILNRRYRCEETGEYLGERELNSREVEFANLMTQVQNNLSTNKPVKAFENLLHAIRLSHPSSGEQAILNYLNQARDNYARENPAHFQEVQDYISTHLNAPISDNHCYYNGHDQQHGYSSHTQPQSTDHAFEETIELLSSMSFLKPSSVLSDAQYPIEGSAHTRSSSSIPTQHFLMNEVYHALLAGLDLQSRQSRVGSTFTTSEHPAEAPSGPENNISQTTSFLDGQGLGALIDLSLQDGTSLHCPECNAVVSRDRFRQHIQYWCTSNPHTNFDDM